MIRIRLVTYLIFFFLGGGGAVKKDAEGGDNGFACRLRLVYNHGTLTKCWVSVAGQWFSIKQMFNYCILFAGSVFS